MAAADGTVDCCGEKVGFPDVFDGVVLDVPLELFVEPVALSRGRASRREPGNDFMDVSAGVVTGNPGGPPAGLDTPAAPEAFNPVGPPVRGLIGACLVAEIEGETGGGGPPGCGAISAGLLDGGDGGCPPGAPGCGNAVEAGGVRVVVAGVVGAEVVGGNLVGAKVVGGKLVGAKVVGVFLGDKGSPAPGVGVVP